MPEFDLTAPPRKALSALVPKYFHVNTVLPNSLFLPSDRALHVMSDLTFKIMSGSPGLIITDIPTVSLPSKEEIVSDMQGEEEEQMFYNLEERRKSGQVKGKRLP